MKLNEAKILIVDDEPDLRDIFAQWLERSGCTNVRTAQNGEAAMASIQADPIDLLITDVRMPVMDGITLVRRLWESGVRVPSIIFVSGFGDVDVREMYALGVEAFLSKPLNREELIGYLERAIANRSDLWLEPMKPAPRQILNVEGDGELLCGEGTHSHLGTLCLGKGGFSTSYSQPLGLGKVAFACELPADPSGENTNPRSLVGQGQVRWFSKADHTVGIEFAYLAPSCREWVLDTIEANHPRSFVPNPKICHPAESQMATRKSSSFHEIQPEHSKAG